MTEPVYIPGQGCGCPRCREPLPAPEPMSPADAAWLQALYEIRRRDFQAAHGRTMGALGRGGKAG